MRNALGGGELPENSEALMEFFKRVLAPLYERYSSTRAAEDFAALQPSRMLISAAVPALATFPAHAYTITCNTPEGSWLLKQFRCFFHTDGNHVGVRSASMELAVLFLAWYYHATFLRSFIQNMPFLYPDSSAILHRVKKSESRTWLKLLVPADATPVISKQLYQMLINAAKNDMYGELETAVLRNVVITERAEYYFLAMQTAIRGQDDLDLEEAQNQRLLQVQKNINTLLQRKNAGSTSMVPSSLSYPSGTRWSIQQAAVKQIVHQIVEMHTIKMDTMQKLFTELAAVTEVFCNSVPQHMAVVLLFVFRSLKEKGDLQRFYVIMDSWKPLARHGIEVVMSKVAKLVLTNTEVRNGRTF